jgi:ATP-binding cassette, subfamily B, bacterial
MVSDSDDLLATPPSPSAAGWLLLRETLRPQKANIAKGIFASLGWTFTKIAIPSVTRIVVDRGIVRSEPGALLRWSVLILVLGLVSATFAGYRRIKAFSASYQTEREIRDQLFAHLQRLPFSFHDNHPTGQLLANSNTDLKAVEGFITMVPITLGNIVTMVGATVVLLFLDWKLALVVLASLPLINVFARRFSHRLHPTVAGLQSELAQLSGVVEETLSGVRVVKGFGAEARQEAQLRTRADNVYERAIASSVVRSTYWPILDILPQLGLVAVLWVGGHRVLSGHLSLGELVAFTSYVLMLVWPLRSTGMVIAQAQRAGVSATRIAEVLTTVSELAEPTHPKHLPPRTPGAVLGQVKFERVSFAYRSLLADSPSTAAVLDQIDLVIAPGETVAIVGATASGKTTLARLVPRFYDATSGRVLLDGVDVRSVPLNELRRNVAMVFDESFLFSDTVRNNLAFARPDATEEDIVKAATSAGAHEFICALPNGYDTVLAERGQSLSGGQRQRIAIARAIVADPRVLILDDATSAVDPTKEHEIRAALGEVMRDRTSIVIAHRAATVAMADRVIVLDAGRVLATGTHEQLLATNDRYREILARAEAGSALESNATNAAPGTQGTQGTGASWVG